MRGEKAFLRIVEAFIAIIIIASVMAFIYVRNIQKPSHEEYVNQLLRITLKEISNNPDLRTAVLTNNKELLRQEIEIIIPNQYSFEFRICQLQDACGLETLPQDKEIFSNEISISSNLEQYYPRKIRIFVWIKD